MNNSIKFCFSRFTTGI
ncbi:hypothetical protein ACE07J_003687 [Salmonella enterica]|nr:hypothetical protein [Salmonella enterica]HCC0890422.1 hypothetical protein [Salmonella enterica]